MRKRDGEIEWQICVYWGVRGKINDVVKGPKYDKRRVNEWMTDS